MRIYVNARHIATGIRNDCNNCPIAIAVQEQFPECIVQVSNDVISIQRIFDDWYISVAVPSSMKRWITQFDFLHRKWKMSKPFDFELPVSFKMKSGITSIKETGVYGL